MGSARAWTPTLSLALAVLWAACDPGGEAADADLETEVDGDLDAEAGADGDADEDGDGSARDADADEDGGGDAPLTCEPISCGPSSGARVDVPAGGDLQAAIDAASRGETIVLQAGATYAGHFVLRAKEGEGCITIRTSTEDDLLPEGERVGPADSALLARVVSPGSGLPAVRTEPRAHGYRLVGLELMPESAASVVHEVVALGSAGDDQSTLEAVPHRLVIDRCFVHGWPEANFKRGIGLNSAETCVIDSTVSDFHSDYQDSQAIGGVNGPGPFRIINNRLEGAAENIMFGGAVPAIHGLVPTGIEVLRNHLFKPSAWRAGDPANTGYVPWVKNLFEIKNGRDVVLEGNLLENNWVGADQHGIAIVLTPRGEDGAAPWATVENVRISNNVVRHVGGAVAVLGYDTGGPSGQSTGITIENNVFVDITAERALDLVRVIQFTEVNGLVFSHNVFQTASPTYPILRTYGRPTTGFSFVDNVVMYGEGLWADCGSDSAALSCLLPGAVFAGNVVVGGGEATLPGGNHFPADLAAVGFVDFAGGAADYHGYALLATSPYAGLATDGTDPGVAVAAIDAARGTSTPP